jgi:RimJ/RimL family protein N-acetyltransferase
MGGFETTTLSTGRLTLRPPVLTDAHAQFEAVDDEVRRWMPWSAGYTVEKALRWCTREAFSDQSREINLVIEPRDTGRFAGVIGLSRADWGVGVAETGYWIGPDARGRGYVTEALRALVAYAFDAGLHRLEILAAPGNTGSQRVAERTGFVREAVLRQARPAPGGGRSDMVLFSMLRGEL